MIKKIPAILFLILCYSLSFGQIKIKIFGVIADASDKKGIPYSTISLIDTLTKSAKSNTFSNELGQFVFDKIVPGNFYITAKSVGYKLYKSNVYSLNTESFKTDTLFIEKTTKDLKEVTVVAVKPLLEVESDKMIYNVENDATLEGLMAIDALKKLPFVTVDGEGNIQMKGSANFKVLLNGKSTSIVAKNPSEALKSFPAALIKKIEVITEPSAKYDAEGTAGIINIITRKKVMGYNGNVYFSYNTKGMNNGGGSFNLKRGKLGFASYFGGQAYKYINQNTSDFTRNSLIPGYKSTLNQHSGNDINGLWYYGNSICGHRAAVCRGRCRRAVLANP